MMPGTSPFGGLSLLVPAALVAAAAALLFAESVRACSTAWFRYLPLRLPVHVPIECGSTIGFSFGTPGERHHCLTRMAACPGNGARRRTDRRASWAQIYTDRRRANKGLFAKGLRMRTVAAIEALARCFSRDQEFLLLDVGTAGGEMLVAIGDVFTKLTAVGVDGLLETLSTRVAPAWAAQADAAQLPFKTDSFDACLLAAVLKHVGRADQALAEVARVVKPGGVVVLIDPNALAVRVGCLVGYFPRSSVAHIFTAGRLRKMLTSAGCEVTSVDFLFVHTRWNWLNSALNCAFKALRLCVILPAWMVFVCRPKERPEYRSGLADP